MKKTVATAIISLSLFAVATPVFAQTADSFADYASSWVAWILLQIVSFFGTFLGVLSSLLITVASYNDFGSESFVIEAWVVVRDFANIFFILALLLIAIATILRIEIYSARRLLFKLVLMAVLINFSRAIATFIVNISQVIMLFFINAFQGVQGLLLTNVLLLNEYLNLAEDIDALEQFDFSGIIGSIIIAGLFVAIGIFVVGTIILLLLFRIIFLWLLIILSPIAFLLHAVPGGASYASQWWSRFTSNLISGPLMAFFLWLAFFAMKDATGGTAGPQSFFDTPNGSQSLSSFGLSITTIDNLQQFLVGVGLLVGGLILTSSIGAAGGGLASKAVGRLQQAGTGTLRRTGRVARGAVGGAVSGVGYATVTPGAKAAWSSLASVPGARLITSEGRKQSRLEREAKSQRGFFGGYATNTAAERELERSYKENNRLDTFSDRKQLIDSKNPVEKAIGLKAALASGDEGATKELYKYINPDNLEGSDRVKEAKLKELQDLEKLAEKEDKTFVGRIKNDGGKLRVKTQDELQEDRRKKVNNRNENEIGKDIRGHLAKAAKSDLKDDELKDLVDTLSAYDLQGARLEYNRGAQRDLAGAIQSIFQKHGDKLEGSMEQQLRKQYDDIQKSKIEGFAVAPLGKSGGSRKQGRVSQEFDRLSSGATDAGFNHIQAGTARVHQGLSQARAGRYDELRNAGRSGANQAFAAYEKEASKRPDALSNVVNPETGKQFSMSELVQARKQKTDEAFEKYDKAVEAFEKASAKDDKKAQAEAEGLINEAVQDIENEAFTIETSGARDKRASFEGRKDDRVKVGAQIQGNASTIRSISVDTNLTSSERDSKITEELDEVETNLESMNGIYEDSIGLNEDQEQLQAKILQQIETLRSNRDERTGSNLDRLSKDLDSLQGTMT